MDVMTKYQVSVEFIRNEFNLGETTSLYEIVNRIVDAYRALKENQTKEPEDDRGIRSQVQRGRPKKADS